MGRKRRRIEEKANPGPRGIAGSLYPTLDLHGRSEADAVRVVRTWLSEQHRSGESVVRLITGRGMHSIGPPVLPRVVGELLSELQKGIVRSYEVEPGGGVFRVRLHVQRASKAPVVEGFRYSPELVRQAEESLAELGIEATAALVDAEVRRILAMRSGRTP